MNSHEVAAVRKFVKKHKKYHVELDNDMFFLLSEKPLDWGTATDKQFEAWEKRVERLTVYSNPINLLILLLADAGNTSTYV